MGKKIFFILFLVAVVLIVVFGYWKSRGEDESLKKGQKTLDNISVSQEAFSDIAVYESENDNIRFKYNKDLAYKVDYSLRYEGFLRYIGFGEGSLLEKGESGYPVEFVIIPEEKESEYVDGSRYVSGFKKDDKFYYFSTYEKAKYGQEVDEMAKSLEFTN